MPGETCDERDEASYSEDELSCLQADFQGQICDLGGYASDLEGTFFELQDLFNGKTVPASVIGVETSELRAIASQLEKLATRVEQASGLTSEAARLEGKVSGCGSRATQQGGARFDLRKEGATKMKHKVAYGGIRSGLNQDMWMMATQLVLALALAALIGRLLLGI
ncbi:hypothetical protein LZ30DRAFT_724156 [Colletotrichum cereale]|nr:hypothetical protein LZ30DRAFT_724156 [Colletotrichum cereale]